MTAARKALAYLQAGHDPRAADRRGAAAGVPQGGRRPRLQVQLGRAGGLLPRLARVARRATWPRACSCLPGSADQDNNLVKRTRAALGA